MVKLGEKTKRFSLELIKEYQLGGKPLSYPVLTQRGKKAAQNFAAFFGQDSRTNHRCMIK